MSTIFLCFDISDVLVNEQCRNQNATLKEIWFHFAVLSRTQSQFCSYCIWAPNVFQFALNCWENLKEKNALKLLDQKQLNIFLLLFCCIIYENFIFDSYMSIYYSILLHSSVKNSCLKYASLSLSTAKVLELLPSSAISGVVLKLRWPDFAHYWPPTYPRLSLQRFFLLL